MSWPLFSKSILALMVVIGLSGCAGGAQPKADSGSDTQSKQSPALVSAYNQAVELMRSELYQEAIEAFTRLEEDYPKLINPRLNIGLAYVKLGLDDKAVESFNKVLEKQPKNEVAWTQLGIMHRKDGKFAEAQQAYEKALATNPNYSDAQLNYGILCDIYLRQPQCALSYFEQYLSENPDDEKVKLWVVDLKGRI